MYFRQFLYTTCLGLHFFSLQAQEDDLKAKISSTEKVTFSSDFFNALLAFESDAKQAMKAWDIPGMAIAVVKDNKTVYAKGFGVKELGSENPVTPDTLFEIGSLSKSFTSALMAMMIDEGKLNWEDPVIKYLPDFVLYDPWVTREFQIQDLLSQRSGLPSYAGDAQVYVGFTKRQMIHNLRYIKPISSFRSTFAYQNSFFLVAGEVLENINGLSWGHLVQQRLFAPLGMRDSTTSLEAYRVNKNANTLHKRLKGKTQKLPADFPYHYVYNLFGPSGGIHSTLMDMTNWLKLQLNHGIFNDAPLISEANLYHTYRRYIYIGKFQEADNYYGLGWAIRDYSPHSIIWHDGGTAGVAHTLAFIPEENLGVIILTNTSGTHLSHALAWQFFDFYYNKPQKSWSKELLEKQILAEKQLEKRLKRPSNPDPSLSFDRYTGIYFNALYGKIEVTLTNKQLMLTIGPNRVQLPLEHWNRDSFELSWPSIQDNNTFFVNFCLDANGDTDQLSIPLMLENDTFKKL